MNRLLLTTLAAIILVAFLSTGCTPAQVLSTADGHTLVVLDGSPGGSRRAHIFHRQTYRTTGVLSIETLFEDGSISPVPNGGEDCLIPELGCTRDPIPVPGTNTYPLEGQS